MFCKHRLSPVNPFQYHRKHHEQLHDGHGKYQIHHLPSSSLGSGGHRRGVYENPRLPARTGADLSTAVHRIITDAALALHGLSSTVDCSPCRSRAFRRATRGLSA